MLITMEKNKLGKGDGMCLEMTINQAVRGGLIEKGKTKERPGVVKGVGLGVHRGRAAQDHDSGVWHGVRRARGQGGWRGLSVISRKL